MLLGLDLVLVIVAAFPTVTAVVVARVSDPRPQKAIARAMVRRLAFVWGVVRRRKSCSVPCGLPRLVVGRPTSGLAQPVSCPSARPARLCLPSPRASRSVDARELGVASLCCRPWVKARFVACTYRTTSSPDCFACCRGDRSASSRCVGACQVLLLLCVPWIVARGSHGTIVACISRRLYHATKEPTLWHILDLRTPRPICSIRMLEALLQARCTRLHTLRLGGVRPGVSLMKKLPKLCPMLRHLDISACRQSPSFLEGLADLAGARACVLCVRVNGRGRGCGCAGLCVLDVPHNALQTGNGTTDAPGSSTIKELIIDADLRARGTVTASRFPSLPDGLHTVSMARWQRIPRGALISIGMLKHIRRFNAMGDAHFPRVLPETFEMTFLGCAATLMELRLASWSLTDGHIVHIARRCRVLRVLVIRQSCVGAPRTRFGLSRGPR